MKFIIKFSLIMGLITLLTVSVFWFASSIIDSIIINAIIIFALALMVFFITLLIMCKIDNIKINLIDIINRYTGKYKPFEFIKNVHPERLLMYLQYEHPQTIACVLSYLKPKKSAYILQKLSDDIQSEVTRRIAAMNKVSPEIIREVERVLEMKLSTMSSEDYETPGGIDSAGKILNSMTAKDFTKKIFEKIKSDDPEFADAIKKKLKK